MLNTEFAAENRSAVLKTLSREDDILTKRLREAIETPTLNRDTG